MAIGAVEATDNGVAHQGGFSRIGRMNHLIGQRGKLRAGQLPFCVQAIDETDNLHLFSGWQSFEFMDDLACGYASSVGF